ncbi:iron-sulfur cluster carrier protein ApbC [Vibrio sp. FNV 38]|nr:iron-sulfur cluster carrier protein ApbC [Vibrio sp. FNV 38]
MRQISSVNEFQQLLGQFEHPHLISGWADQPSLIKAKPDGVIQVMVPFASHTLVHQLSDWIAEQHQHYQLPAVEVVLEPQALTTVTQPIKGVKNVIAVTSAKGGVGKSTTAVNLALSIAQTGAKVGILDADIYGPSIPLMMGTLNAKLQVRDNKWMQPIHQHGIATQSIGYLVAQDEAAIWRGPMASKALDQMVNETEWPELDYLVLDMPPGTGDIQLTLSQQIPVTGAIIVTTPQDLALADARKGAAMFNKVDVPVVGLVENMSYHVCSQCGHHEAIFGTGGAQRLAQDFQLSVLAQVPLHIDVREDIDSGEPTVTRRPESQHAEIYAQLADQVCSKLFWQGTPRPESIAFTMLN